MTDIGDTVTPDTVNLDEIEEKIHFAWYVQENGNERTIEDEREMGMKKLRYEVRQH